MSGHTRSLATLAAHTTARELPANVRHEALRSMVNYFAVALAAARDPTVDAALRVMLPFSGGEACTLIGRRERTDMPTAAAINAMAANVYDFDDTHIPTIVHPTAPVAAALFALAETREVSGEDFLLAFALGVEVECRIANALSPSHYARGWHITSSCGVFGAAAAAGRLMNLTEAQLTWALGCAAAQSSGLVETLGTSAKSISVGNAARNGLLSALLAKEGFDGPAAPLEGAFGWMRVVNDSVDWSALAGEADRWQLQRNTFKPYPCGVVLNPVIDACLELAARPDYCREGITRITLTGHPLLRQRTDRPAVTSGRQSQVSAQHAVGITLTRARAGLAEFSDEAVRDASARTLGAKVTFVDNAAMSVEAAQATLHYAGGASLSVNIDAARGSLARPLTDDELNSKLRALCGYGQSGVAVEPLRDALWALPASRDVGGILCLASRN
jgi:2-methylcitrate dehydratase PrpD